MLKKNIQYFLLVFILLISFIFFINKDVKANENIDLSTYYENSDVIYDMSNISNITPLLDSDNKEITIDKYNDKLLGKNVSGNKKGVCLEYNVSNDDPIVNIVPREYFLNEGTYFKDGEEYAYYIVTAKRNGKDYSNTNFYNGEYFVSHVLIIDYESNISEINYSIDKSLLKHSINVHQYTYFTLDLANEYIYLPSVFGLINFSLDENYNKDNIVIPAIEYDFGEYEIQETGDFFTVKNSSASEEMENEHINNSNEGRFFISAFHKYKGRKIETYKYDKIENAEIVEWFISLAPKLGKISTILTVGEIYGRLWDALYIKEYSKPTIIDNSKTIDEMDFLETSKNNQIITYGKLIKSLLYLSDNIELKYDDFIEYNFRYSCNTGEESSTKIISNINYDIYINGEFDRKVTHTKTFRLIDDNKKELEINKPIINEYNMRYTSQSYYFKCMNSQKYNLYISYAQNIKILDENNNEIENDNGYYLEANKEYSIIIYNNSPIDKEYDIKINYININNEVSISPNQKYYFNYHCDNSDVYFIDNIPNDIKTNFYNKLYDINYLIRDNDYVIEIYNNTNNKIIINPNITIPNENNTKYIYKEIENTGDYKIFSDNLCFTLKNNEICNIIREKIIYINKSKIYSKSDIYIEKIDCTYVPYINDTEIIYDGINRIRLGSDINIKIKKYNNLEYIEEYNEYKIEEELPNKMDTSIYNIHITNIPNIDTFSFKLAPLNPTIKEIGFTNNISDNKIEINTNITFEETFTGTVIIYVDFIDKKDISIDYKITDGVGDPLITLKDDDLKNNNYLMTIYIYSKYNGNNNILSQEECMINIDKNKLINYLLSYDFSNYYLNYLHDKVNDEINASGIKVNSYNRIIYQYKEYIYSTIETERIYGETYYNVRKELQLLVMLDKYIENMQISFDDGINYDSYIYGDAIIYNIRIMNNLHFKDYEFSIHSSYLYAKFYGLGYIIYNLNLDKDYLFIANYGEIDRIKFFGCSFKEVFKTYGYGEESRVIVC